MERFNPDNSPEAMEARRLALQETLELKVMAQLKEGHKYIFPHVAEVIQFPVRVEPDDLVA